MEGDRAEWVDYEVDIEESRAIVRSVDSEVLDTIVRSVDSEVDRVRSAAIVWSGWIMRWMVRSGGRSCGVWIVRSGGRSYGQ